MPHLYHIKHEGGFNSNTVTVNDFIALEGHTLFSDTHTNIYVDRYRYTDIDTYI